MYSGDPGGDLFTSPGDPAFYTHHSMMDRMWTYWYASLSCPQSLTYELTFRNRQLLDPKSRFTEEQMNGGVYGHLTWADEPPSRVAKFSDVLDMGYAGDSITIGEVMSTTSGPFCYYYL